MKTLIAILLFTSLGFAQTPKPIPHPHLRPNLFTSKQAIVNQPFSVSVPALAAETGCGLQVFGMRIPPGDNQGWALANGTFSGKPTLIGFYRIVIKCTTPQPVTKILMLRVSPKAPLPPAPSPEPASIPLN